MANLLAQESSPYLLQHAHNPVDWHPWGDVALARSRDEARPILLSIGYAACHWCHVMERESFEDAETAALMNEHFVCIKVDREERPDLDAIYMQATQAMTGHGGWPMTVFLTPAGEPFFAGTYFPPDDRHGMPSFRRVLLGVADAWKTRQDSVVATAQSMRELYRASTERTASTGVLGEALLSRAMSSMVQRYEPRFGGFDGAPKFPPTMTLDFALRQWARTGEAQALEMVTHTFRCMARGGIYDQVGGGFSRYSVDASWLVPHFEKMLYDNALLLRTYVDGHRVFTSPLFESTARDLAAYVTREMTDGSGGYYASQDADSEGEEGKFFVWNPAGVRAALADDELAANVALAYFGVSEEGNFVEHGRVTGMTVLHENRPIHAVAAQLDLTEEVARSALERARKRLFDARDKRPKPFRDEKILTSWGALMISAMAEAGAALQDPALIASAERALALVEQRLVTRDPTGQTSRALRLVKGEVVKGPGFLDDHAYLANAALDLYEVTGEPSHVELAQALASGMIGAFWQEGEGFFFTPKDGESLITRSKDPYDNAVPSGASMACRALLRLGTLVDAKYIQIAERELSRLAASALANPFGFGQTLCELDRLVRGSVDVVLVGARHDPRTKALAGAVFSRWIPNRTVAWLDPDSPASRAACALLAEGKPAQKTPVAYVCRGRTCSLPVSDAAALGALLPRDDEGR